MHAEQSENGTGRLGDIEYRVEVAVDEVGELQPVEVGEVVAEPAEAVGLFGAARGRDLLGHGLPPVPQPDLAAVGVAGPVHRVDGMEPEVVVHVDARSRERVAEDAGHGEHARARVDAVAPLLHHAGPAARHVLPLQHQHVVAPPGQVAGGGEPTQPGPDHDDVHDRLAAPSGTWKGPETGPFQVPEAAGAGGGMGHRSRPAT